MFYPRGKIPWKDYVSYTDDLQIPDTNKHMLYRYQFEIVNIFDWLMVKYS